MIRSFLRFVNGYLKINVRGRNASRFFSLCARRGIELWKIKSLGDNNYSAYILKKDFKRIAKLRRKTGVGISIVKKHGLCFYLFRYRKRKVLIPAFIFSAVFVFFFTGRIWKIEIIGCASLGEDTILDYLKENNIVCGIPGAAIDNDALELSLRQDFDEIIWASVYEEGTKLVVCVQEELKLFENNDADEVCTDLVATEDAVVSSIVTRSGLAAVKAGDEVKAGDILVNGRQEILNDDGEVGEYYYKSADADVMGYVEKEYEDWIDETQTDSYRTGKEHSRLTLTVSGYRFVTPKLYSDFELSERIEDMHRISLFGGISLPVNYSVIRDYELTEKSKNLSLDEAKELALSNLEQFISDLEENGVLISDKNVMIEKIGKKYHIYGQIKVCENIAKSSPTEVIEEGINDELE
jgi:similar to stage IV sporulation protein